MSHNAKISLACVTHDYIGLLFKGETEIVYSNQVGGTSCSHPHVEGFLVVLNGGPPGEKEDPFFDQWPREFKNEDRDSISNLLNALGLNEVLEAPLRHELAEEDWARIGEAWVPIKVKDEPKGFNADPVENLKGRIGILTYPNSD